MPNRKLWRCDLNEWARTGKESEIFPCGSDSESNTYIVCNMSNFTKDR